MTPDVNVVLIDFHRAGKEMVVENEDGSFTILINSRLSYKGQLEAYRHAMRHIENEDFQKDSVQAIESAAHDMAVHDIAIPDNADRIPADQYVRRIKRLQAQRRKIQRQLKEREEDMAFLGLLDSDSAFDRAQHHWLYGHDL